MDLGKKRLFLLDLDGTVYLEETLLPGAAAFFRWAADRGAQVRYLTNNSSRGVEAGLEKMHRLGVPARREEFLTAVEAAIYYLRTRRKAGEAYYVVGTESFCSQLRQAGIDVRHTPDADVAAVLVGFDTELCYQKVEDACRLLFRGADFLATNPDLACPTLYGFMPDCGAICRLIISAVGREPAYIGKPDPTMIRLALEQTGCAAEEALMVGDRLYTDIACGRNAGVDTVLVLTGEATAADAAASSTPPTLICRDIAELLTRIREAQT